MLSTFPTAVMGVVAAWLLLTAGTATPLAGLLTLVSFLLMFPLAFGLTYLSTLVCFWTKRYLGIMWLREALLSFFSGLMIPLAFMPGSLQGRGLGPAFPALHHHAVRDLPGARGRREHLGLLAAEAACWAVGLWVLGWLILPDRSEEVTVHGG